jgi:hypothetical protein
MLEGRRQASHVNQQLDLTAYHALPVMSNWNWELQPETDESCVNESEYALIDEPIAFEGEPCST